MIDHLDPLVLTVRNIDVSCHFHTDVLGRDVITSGDSRKALKFGSQEINLHQPGHDFEPKATNPTPGSADRCFISEQPLEDLITHLNNQQIDTADPIQRTGATQPIFSVYKRAPDGNLRELSN